MNRMIPRAAAALLLMLLTATTAWAGNVTLSVDPDIAEGTAGHYYVNMPATGTNTLTLTDASITTFKVYDNGGKVGNYSINCNGYLVINVPVGYHLQLTGSVIDCSTGLLGIWEGSDTENADKTLVSGIESQNVDVNATSGSRSIVFYFQSNQNVREGFDITVTLVEAPEHNISFTTAANGSATASVGGTVVTTAKEEMTVTLTATPADGYLLADVSVTCGDENVAVAVSPWTNSATFTMPTGDVTVTPTFATSEGFFITMPVTGVKRLAIPESVTSFNVYDDGGPDGSYSIDCNGYLVITAPVGYNINLTGSIDTEEYSDIIYVYNGTDPDNLGTELLRESGNKAIDITSESGNMIIRFSSNGGYNYPGLNLTVTLVETPDYNLNFTDATNGSMVASVEGMSVTKAKKNMTVTLTATPADGYLLADVSVTSGGEAVALTWDVWTNSATFTMPAGEVTVTPTFTTKADLFVNMPKTGTRTVTIPDGVTSFKLYDDGGPDGNYSANCDGILALTLPDGYHFHLSGSVTAGTDRQNSLYVITGNNSDYNPTIIFKSSTAGVETVIEECDFDGNIRLRFLSNSENQYAGLDLTVTLVGAEHNVTVNNADNVGGSVVTAYVGGVSATKATTGQTVTLAASPAEGYVLGALSVRNADGKVVDVTDMLWYINPNTNTATFTMPNSDVTVTPVFTNVMTAEGGLTVNMRKESGVQKVVTIPSGVTSFKVYDYGGADCNYSDNYSGKLTLTAPEGCVLQMSGTITTQSGDGDFLNVTDGNADTDDYLLYHVSSTTDGVATAIPTVVSTGNKIDFSFSSDASVNYAGLDLTVTVISPGTDYSVSVSNGDTNKGTMQASTTTAQLGTEITLTATPAAGYVLSDLSVTCGGRAVKTNWNVWTNSATFKMPNGDVTVTPTFTNDLTKTSLAVCLPATDYFKYATIPEGVKSFKIYDDGGPTGNYTAYCNGTLNLIAPEGSLLRFTGSVVGPEDKFILGIAGNQIATATKNDIDVTSTNNEPHIDLRANGYETTNGNTLLYGDTGAGLDLTATVLYAVSVSTSIANGTVTADKTHAAADETVTLTVAPATGYVLSDLSVTCGGRAVKTNWNVWTNSATFKMPDGNVTVTPTFTNDLGSLAVNLPATDYKFATIPEGVKSFKIYDDGGPTGNYTAYCNGTLNLIAPEGSLLRFTGSVVGPEDKFILGIAGNQIATATKNDIDVTSTDNEPHIDLRANGYETTNGNTLLYGDTGAGLDLTATVLYAVNVPTSIANGTVTADKTHAAADETVTLTVAPATNCTIGSVSINGQPLEAVNGVYSFKMPAKNVTVTAHFRKLLRHDDIIVSDIVPQKYDGTALTPALLLDDCGSPMTEGTDYTISPETATDAGDYTVTITGIGNYDGTATKTFTISRRTVTLTSATESRAYDGTALTADGVAVSGNGFAEGEGATYTVTGTQTDAGSSANTFTYTLNDGTKASNYDITKVEGTLTVTALTGVTVTITGHTECTPYDGTEHTISGYDVKISSTLYTEGDFTFSGTDEASRTDAGTTDMGLAANQFANTNTNFAGVTFSVTDGGMTITPKKVTAPTAVTGLIYTGSEQTGVAGGDAYTVTDGTATAAGDYTATATLNDADNYQWSDQTTAAKEIAWSIAYYAAAFANAADNDDVIAGIISNYGSKADVTLSSRTLYKDGAWNTLCLPFDVTIASSPLADDNVVAMTLDAANSGLSGSTLTLNFEAAGNIPAGTPFIIKWDKAAGYDSADPDTRDLKNPVFSGVTITSTSTEVSFTGGKFKGTYKPISYTAENKSILLVGGDNLYWPKAGASINAFRAYFDLGTNEAREFVVNFGNDDIATSMLNAQCFMLNEADAWYSLDGRKLDKQPTKKGLYIHNGRKVVIK